MPQQMTSHPLIPSYLRSLSSSTNQPATPLQSAHRPGAASRKAAYLCSVVRAAEEEVDAFLDVLPAVEFACAGHGGCKTVRQCQATREDAVGALSISSEAKEMRRLRCVGVDAATSS